MNRFVYEVLLPLTLMGSAATLILFGLQHVFSCVGKHLSGLLAWCIALLFFLIPVSLPVSLLLRQERFSPWHTFQGRFVAVSGPAQVVSEGALKLAALSPLAKLLPWVSAAWLVGFCISVLSMAVRFYCFSHSLSTQRIPLENVEIRVLYEKACAEMHFSEKVQAYTLPGIQSPFTCGLLHPAIYFPQRKLQPWALSLAIRHELMHIQHRHLWIKAAAEWAALVHWFNPLAYLFKRQLDAACEIRCDLLLTKGMDAAQRKAYGGLLVHLAGPPPKAPIHALSQKGRQLSMRLLALRQAMPSKQQKTLAVLLAAFLLIPCVPAAAACENTVQNTVAGVSLLKSALSHSEDFLPSDAMRAGSAAAPEALIALQWPIPKDRYCSRMQNSGLCIVAEPQTEIMAAADGVVLATSQSTPNMEKSYGQTVVLVHSTNTDISTCYTHCDSLFVQPGDTVKAGQVIATVGNSGEVSGPMCRYQVCIDGALYNPARWYPSRDFTQ